MTPAEAIIGDLFDSTFDFYQFGLPLHRMRSGNAAFDALLAKEWTYHQP